MSRMINKCDEARFFIERIFHANCLFEISKVLRFQHERRGKRRRGFRSVTTTFNNDRHRKLRLLERRDAQKPTVDSRMLIVHDHLVILANDVPLVIALDLVLRLHLAGLRIVKRHNFLRRSRLATSIDSRRLHWSKHAARGSTRTTRNESHDRPQARGGLRRHHLIEHLRRDVVLDARLHQLAFHVCNRRRRERHLKRRHLARKTLPVSHQREIVSRNLLAGDNRRFARCERTFDRVSTRIPDLRQLATTQRFRRHVVRTDAKQLRRAFQTFRSELHAHLREVLVTRNLIRLIDLETTVHFAGSTIVEDHPRSGRRVVTTATASELSILFASEKRRGHRHGFESRTRNVVRTERTTDERLVAFIRFETDPRRFVVDFLETIRRLTVHREHVASLRIEYHDRAVLSFQLVHRRLLQRTIDREPDVLIALVLDVLALDDLERFRHRATLRAEERALESGIATIRARDVCHRFVHRILTLDVAARVALVVSEWLVDTAAAIEDPTAQGRFRETSDAQILVAQILKLLIVFGSVMSPVDVKAK